MSMQRNPFQLLAICLVAAAGTLMITGTMIGAMIPLEATIDGAQANEGNGTGSPGTGFATMTLDTDTDLFSWDISWSGLIGTETVMHFHGPAMPGENAGVRVNFGAISGTSSPSVGSTTLTDMDLQDELLGGLWYINIHSNAGPEFPLFGGGEIRGQVSVVPEPVSIGLFGVGLLSVIALNRRRQRVGIAG